MCGICRGGFGAWYCEGGRGRVSRSLDLGSGGLSVFLKKRKKEKNKEETNGEYSVGVTDLSSPTDRNRKKSSAACGQYCIMYTVVREMGASGSYPHSAGFQSSYEGTAHYQVFCWIQRRIRKR